MHHLAAHLKSRLHEQLNSRSISPNLPSASSSLNPDAASSSVGALRQHPDIPGTIIPHASSSKTNRATPEASSPRGRNGTSELSALNGNKPSPDPFLDLLFLGWNPDLPDPGTLNH